MSAYFLVFTFGKLSDKYVQRYPFANNTGAVVPEEKVEMAERDTSRS